MTFTKFDGSTIGARSSQLDLNGKIRSEVFEIVGAVVDSAPMSALHFLFRRTVRSRAYLKHVQVLPFMVK